jgi:hypothetical protein
VLFGTATWEDSMSYIDIFRELSEIRTANALDLPLRVVQTLNVLERNSDNGEVEVKIEPGRVEVEWECEGFNWVAFVRPDGSLDYTLGGALPELGKHNR